MSSSDDANGETRPSREVAYRLFAAEFDDTTFSYSESDEERAPNYVVTPTGARVNRLFAVGVLTEVERVNDDVLRGRVVDPTGAFVTYAGQYQPDEMAFLDRASPPAFVALSGKARTFQPEDSDRVFTSVRPESVSRVDADTRDRWTVTAAEATLERVGVMAAAIRSGLEGEALGEALTAAGVDESMAAGVPLAIDRYGTTPGYLAALRRVATDALEVVAGERESVRPLELAPGDAGEAVDVDALAADLDLDLGVSPTETAAEPATATADEAQETPPEAEPSEATSEPEPGTTPETVESTSSTAATPATEESETVASSEIDESAGADSDTSSQIEANSASTDETTVDETSADETTAGEPTDTEEGLGDFDAGDESSAADADIDAGSGPAPDDELGDFEATTSTTDAGDQPAEDEMYELDAEEREEIESEFGTEFSTGSEVAPAGEADIDVPSVEELEDELDADDQSTPAETAAEATPADETGETTTDEVTEDDSAGETDAGEDAGAGAGADVDLEAAAVDAIEELDDGDGATREAVVARVVDEYGADPGDVEDAIQSALMSGQCYEPSEDALKAI